MREGAKRRLVGAVVIVALAVIFVPMLFEDESLAPPLSQALLPDEPGFDTPFEADLDIPLSDQSGEDSVTDLGAESAPLDLPPPDSLPRPETDFDGLQPGQIGNTDVPEPAPAESASRASSTERPAAPAVTAAPERAAPTPRAKPEPKPAAPPVPPPPPPAEGVPSWVVQVASLGSSASATNLADKLKAAGFTAFVEKAEVRGKTFYRVRVGPEVNRDAAERAAAMLRQQQKLDTLIQRYP
ncbi:hypothetical protein G3480_09475 [Thiorhodococcus mannitoliphagus]|uniref:SPOR domain-containing protein n=1 Tax=Thiorhodococcus mannitoliphagus TaxID=329406 RepID=A0A6P1DQI8_9GAMM|nr:SPOR domain-containing protein [Thiorhodococcus mannitoliphagus]NEX20537.1 hypothetical protein [Thiorhodococcus mannitoliphagus]